jgi:diguanylate cyclase (GGDEF)-like protein
VFKTAYHVMLCFGVYAWCGYADTEYRGNLFSTRKQVMLSAIPLGLLVLLIISNLWTHSLFNIDENGYVRGKLFHLEMGLLVAITTVFSVRLLLRARGETDPIKRGHMKLVSSFPLCLLIAWLLSIAGESFPIICVAITIELLCLYMGTSTQQISMDKLTQVNNRQNLMSFLEYKCVNHCEKMFLFMMDLDYFKTINDTYGHLEGDDALIRAAKALKMSCGDFRRRPYIARYGGDEFIVVIESTKQEADQLLENIRNNLDALNASANKPYKLAFSIGVAEYHPGMDANALIEAADSELYKIKRARPAQHKP